MCGPLTPCVAHLLHVWPTYSMCGPLTPYVAHLLHAWPTYSMRGPLTLCVAHLLYAWPTCSMRGPLTLCVAHLLYAWPIYSMCGPLFSIVIQNWRGCHYPLKLINLVSSAYSTYLFRNVAVKMSKFMTVFYPVRKTSNAEMLLRHWMEVTDCDVRP